MKNKTLFLVNSKNYGKELFSCRSAKKAEMHFNNLKACGIYPLSFSKIKVNELGLNEKIIQSFGKFEVSA